MEATDPLSQLVFGNASISLSSGLNFDMYSMMYVCLFAF